MIALRSCSRKHQNFQQLTLAFLTRSNTRALSQTSGTRSATLRTSSSSMSTTIRRSSAAQSAVTSSSVAPKILYLHLLSQLTEPKAPSLFSPLMHSTMEPLSALMSSATARSAIRIRSCRASISHSTVTRTHKVIHPIYLNAPMTSSASAQS